ncbi:hypothetical protein ACWD5R_45290 [Streptomyces sp. NPDC002514]|uniref:hypothetical protein n=1 Tax=unclassified Streptomyces TaxID=2593676 RepID=UPI0036A82689
MVTASYFIVTGGRDVVYRFRAERIAATMPLGVIRPARASMTVPPITPWKSEPAPVLRPLSRYAYKSLRVDRRTYKATISIDILWTEPISP